MAEPGKDGKELTVQQQISGMAAQFKAALPPHIPVERFVRIVLTAVNGNPDLQRADRRSLFEAAMKCAADGLVPDGRDAAFVIYGNKAVYMPMVWGIVKKVRNSGELAEITSHVVHANDEFSYEFGDHEGIKHKPNFSDRGKPIGAYAIAKTKDGAIYREFMTADEINSVKEISKSKDKGPWAGPFYLEMWRKTVIRRLAKRLPMSTDLEDFFRRDDEHYDFKARAEPVMPREKVDPTFGSEGAEYVKRLEPEMNESAAQSSQLLNQLGEDQARENAEKEVRESEKSEPKARENSRQEETLSLIAQIESATVQNWEAIFSRVNKEIGKLKTPEEQLEVTKVINRKKKELFS